MYCIVSYCVLCMYLICYLYTIVLTRATRNKDIYKWTGKCEEALEVDGKWGQAFKN